MKKRKGFGSLDLVLYGVGLIILIGGGILGYSNFLDTAKIPAATTQTASIFSAVSRYKSEVGSYPTNLQALLVQNGSLGPWLSSLPSPDPWGIINTGINGSGGVSAYCYSRTSTGFAVWSLGKNGTNNSGGNGSVLPLAISGDDVGFIGNQ